MTVGELVMAELPDLLPRGQVVVGSQFAGALKDLGIWDAEVLEGTAAMRGVGWPYQIPLRPRKPGWEQVISFGRKRPFRSLGVEGGQKLRVILIPEK